MRDVTVVYHIEPEGYWAESPEVAGFSAAGETLSEVREMAREGLRFHVGPDMALVERFPDSVTVVSLATGSGKSAAIVGSVSGEVVRGQAVTVGASAHWRPIPASKRARPAPKIANAAAS
jgi:predicted RNase H-like HicB family nuclease